MASCGDIDYAGSALVEKLYPRIIIPAAVVAFFVGYAMSSFLITFYILAAGVLVAVVTCVPPWPQYKRLNIEWLETADDVPTFAEPEVMEGEGAEGTGEARVQRTQQAVAPKAAAQVGKSTNARAGGAAKASKR